MRPHAETPIIIADEVRMEPRDTYVVYLLVPPARGHAIHGHGRVGVHPEDTVTCTQLARGRPAFIQHTERVLARRLDYLPANMQVVDERPALEDLFHLLPHQWAVRIILVARQYFVVCRYLVNAPPTFAPDTARVQLRPSAEARPVEVHLRPRRG